MTRAALTDREHPDAAQTNGAATPPPVRGDPRSIWVLHMALGRREPFRCLYIGPDFDGTVASLRANRQCAEVLHLEPAGGQPSIDHSCFDLCFIEAEESASVVMARARSCLRAMAGRGVIVFRSRTSVGKAIIRFLGEIGDYVSYPLAHDLLVVEIGVPTLLSDHEVASEVTRPIWLKIQEAGRTRLALRSRLGAHRRMDHVAVPLPPRRTRPKPGSPAALGDSHGATVRDSHFCDRRPAIRCDVRVLC